MNTYAIDDHYKLGHAGKQTTSVHHLLAEDSRRAVARLQSISLKGLEEEDRGTGVQQLADVKVMWPQCI
jgi:hypothetical protein